MVADYGQPLMYEAAQQAKKAFGLTAQEAKVVVTDEEGNEITNLG